MVDKSQGLKELIRFDPKEAIKTAQNKTEILARAQATAPLLYCQGIIYQISEPKKVFPAIEKLSQLRESVSRDDFILTKYLLKLLVGYYPEREEYHSSMFDQKDVKKMLD